VNDPASTASADFIDNPGLVAHSSLSVIYSHLGMLTDANLHAAKALALADEHGHHHSSALARCHIAALHQGSRNFAVTQEIAATGIALSTDKGFPYCLACSTIQHGWARAMLTAGREGIPQILDGVAAYRATGAVLWQAYFLALLAEAQLVSGQSAECLRTITEGLTLAQARGNLLPEADLYRIKGDLLLTQESAEHRARSTEPRTKSKGYGTKNGEHAIARGGQKEAEAYFHKSIDIARAQQAKALELRATLRLVHLWQQQGEHTRGYDALALLADSFHHREDTAEVQEAQAILSQLRNGLL
jgi:hypothetical protein